MCHQKIPFSFSHGYAAAWSTSKNNFRVIDGTFAETKRECAVLLERFYALKSQRGETWLSRPVYIVRCVIKLTEALPITAVDAHGQGWSDHNG